MNKNPYIHPVHQVNDGIMSSYKKVKIDLVNPTPDMFNPQDIAKGLANTCRFGGQTEGFYSVAQHSILVMMLAPKKLQLAALLHDASEAYLGDIIKPVKNLIGDKYAQLEAKFEKAIFEQFKADCKLLDDLKPYDKQALQLEYEYLHEDGIGFEMMFKGLVFRERDREAYPVENPYQILWGQRTAYEQYLTFLLNSLNGSV
ncbi:hypothetical protein [Pelobium manganitolerans]|uniref:hypothetical protein n=1 Tax=Pelobium manganitolerans TaxID=1842495 RepID=UPI003FA3D8FE